MKTITIENKSGKVKLNEVVTRESVGRMIDEIGKLFGASASAQGADFGEIMNAAENAVDVLEIEVNSPGGSVFDGYTIYQEIKSLQDRGVTVNATITGMAASMASVICMACDKVSIVPHGRMMIHNASSGVSGNAAQLRKTADLLDSISADIADIYASRTKMDVEQIKALMDEETWMPAAVALSLGFVDEIVSKKSHPVETTTKAESENITPTEMIFLTNKAALEKISGLEARTVELEADITAANDTIAALQGEAATHTENLATITAELGKATAELATAQATIADQEATVTAANEKLDTFDAEVAAKALLQVSSIGFQGEIPITNEEAGKTISLREQINAIPDAKKRQEARLKNWDKL